MPLPFGGRYGGGYADVLAAYHNQPRGGSGVSYNPNYYRNLLAQGYTVDPSTGHAIPGARAAGNVPSDEPVVLNNPFTDDSLSPEEREQIVQEQTRQQQPMSRTAPTGTGGFVDDMLNRPAITPGGSVQQVSQDMLPSPTQQAFGSALHQQTQARAQKAASEWANLVKAASQPGMLRSDVEDLQQQWAQAYPEFADNPPVPMSPEQLAEVQKKIKLHEWRGHYEQIGVPGDLIIDLDEKGKPVGPTPAEYWRSQNEQRNMAYNAVKDQREFYKHELDTLTSQRDDLNKQLANAHDHERANIETQLSLMNARIKGVAKVAFGFDPDAQMTAAQPERMPRAGERGSGTPQYFGPAESAKRLSEISFKAASESPPVKLEVTDPQTIAQMVASGSFRPGQILEAGGFRVQVNQDGKTVRPLEAVASK